VLRFGDFEFRPSSLVLTKHGKRLKLSGHALDLLLLLLERPGEVVSREQIRHRLWPDTYVDFEHGLDVALSRLRATLGDSGKTPRYVETLPRKGYRFIAPVKDVLPGRRMLRRLVRDAILAVLCAVLALGMTRPRYPPSSQTSTVPARNNRR